MKILKMTASFGKLNQTLLPSDGLYIHTAPNEAGKTTWAAFLLAMLYGIDSSERVSKANRLPAKLRYAPWSGAPMQGSMEILWQGRRITLERSGTPRAPMSQFRAYESESGVELQELDGRSCGERLLGAKRSVFERSAFIRQASLPIDMDAELDARLTALVTTGDVGGAYSKIKEKLTRLRNDCRHNQTGEIPKLERQRDAIREKLEKVEQIQNTAQQLSEQLHSLQAQIRTDQALLERWRMAEALENTKALRQAEQERQMQLQALQALQEQVKSIPDEPAIRRYRNRYLEIQNAARQSRESLVRYSQPLPPPEPPAVFAGCTDEQALEKARQAVQTLQEGTPRHSLPYCLAAVLLLASAAVFWFCGLWGCIPAGIALAFLIGGLLYNRKKAAADARATQNILARYNAENAEDCMSLAQHYARQYQCWRDRTEEQKKARQEAEQALQEHNTLLDELCRQLRGYAPVQAGEMDAQLAAWQRLWDQYNAEEKAAHAIGSHYRQLASLVPNMEIPEDVSAPDIPKAVLQERLDRNIRLCDSLRQKQAGLAGQLSVLGDPISLYASVEQLSQRLQVLQRRYDALTLALDALEKANQTLRARFAPQIARLAGEHLAAMTHSRYERLLLDRDLAIQVYEPDSSLLRSAHALSTGTVDQLYLAVRLAMAELLLAPDCPLILDDALINFDDTRAESALSLLMQQAEKRQILLFTCHGREQRLYEQLVREQNKEKGEEAP